MGDPVESVPREALEEVAALDRFKNIVFQTIFREQKK